jgi:hypothetical protein
MTTNLLLGSKMLRKPLSLPLEAAFWIKKKEGPIKKA